MERARILIFKTKTNVSYRQNKYRKSFLIQRKFDIINHFKILGQIDRYKKRKEEVRRRRRPTTTDQPYVSYQRSNRTFLGSWARAFALCSSLASPQRAARAAMSRSSVRSVDVVSGRARAIVVFLVRLHCTPTESSARARPLSLLSMDQVGLAMPGSSSFLFWNCSKQLIFCSTPMFSSQPWREKNQTKFKLWNH